jgi:hypothetical protein
MQAIIDFLSHIEVGAPTAHQNLAVFPILNGFGAPPGYLTLDEALARKAASVTEVSAGGSVPELQFVNSGGCPVFLLDGEELVGAKQNRVLNLSIMVPAGKTLIIPVSCVERGRWHYRSGEFHSSAQAHHSEGRAKRIRQVTDSMISSGRRESDQGEVWRDLDLKFTKLREHSSTSAMADMYDSAAGDLEQYARAAAIVPRQVGAMFAVGGSVVGLDLFDSADTFTKLLPKLARSYALDALSERRSSGGQAQQFPMPRQEDAKAFLQSVLAAEARAVPATGEGEDVRLTGHAIAGAALVVDGRVIHLSAFRTRGDSPAAVM